MRSISELYDLQLLDWAIQENEEELADIGTKLADDVKRIQAHRQLAVLEQKLDELRPLVRSSERTVEQIEGRISTMDGRLYSGMVTNPRELEAYQEESASLARNQSNEEDRLLDLMVAIEETEEFRDRAKSIFDQIDGERRREVAELESRQSELSSGQPELLSQRQTLATEYPAGVLAVYETVRRSRGGQGAARIDQRGMCEGCRLRIPNVELSQARSGEGVVQCGSCFRILIYG